MTDYDWITQPGQQRSRTARLTEAQVWMIRFDRKLAKRSTEYLAFAYGVSKSRIRALRRGVGWRHVTRDWILENRDGARGSK